jgi:cobalt-precorrin-7 (C5)-methyltransferase
LGKIFAVGVGPGSPKYVTQVVKEIIQNCDVLIGYKYTLKTIEEFLDGKEVHEITMNNQEESYQQILPILGGRTLVVPFTGDVNFSESEVVDRLIEIFGEVEVVPGISSKVITLHVTTSIEEKKLELQKALIDGYSVILVPRPWPKQPDKHFMPSEIALYLKRNNFKTESMKVHVFESLTTDEETSFQGTVKDLEGREFSDLSVMVFNQTELDSYMNYKWQWEN